MNGAGCYRLEKGFLNKDYIANCRPSSRLTEQHLGARDMSRIESREPEDLCQCPCHLEGLECHSCYVVGCRTLRFEAELRKVTAQR